MGRQVRVTALPKGRAPGSAQFKIACSNTLSNPRRRVEFRLAACWDSRCVRTATMVQCADIHERWACSAVDPMGGVRGLAGLKNPAFGCLSAVGCLSLLAVAGLFVLTRDEPPPDVSDFEGYRSEVPDKDNGFLLLDIERGSVFWPPDANGSLERARTALGDASLSRRDPRYREFVRRFDFDAENFDIDGAEIVLQRNRDISMRLSRALEAKSFQLPELRGPDPSIGHVSECRTLANLEGCRARWEFERGHLDRAYRATTRVLRLARRVQGGEGTRFEALLAHAMEHKGWRYVRWLLDRAPPPERERRELVALARDDDATLTRDMQQAYRADLWMMRDYIGSPEWTRWYGRVDRFFLLPNRTLREIAEALRAGIANVGLPLDKRTVLPRTDPRFWQIGNYPGRREASHVRSMSTNWRKEELLAQRRAARLLLALRAHFDAHGVLPESLEDLRDEHTEGLPVSPSTGEPFLYDRTAGTLLSSARDPHDGTYYHELAIEFKFRPFADHRSQTSRETANNQHR